MWQLVFAQATDEEITLLNGNQVGENIQAIIHKMRDLQPLTNRMFFGVFSHEVHIPGTNAPSFGDPLDPQPSATDLRYLWSSLRDNVDPVFEQCQKLWNSADGILHGWGLHGTIAKERSVQSLGDPVYEHSPDIKTEYGDAG